MIVTLLVTRLPESYTALEQARFYDFRGWTFFERSSAELIKPSKALVVEEGKYVSEGRYLWAMIIDSSVEDANEGRRPPLAPVAFTELLQTKRFTNDADVDGVARLYEKTATQVLGATPKLELSYMPVREGDGLDQAVALRFHLRKLDGCDFCGAKRQSQPQEVARGCINIIQMYLVLGFLAHAAVKRSHEPL